LDRSQEDASPAQQTVLDAALRETSWTAEPAPDLLMERDWSTDGWLVRRLLVALCGLTHADVLSTTRDADVTTSDVKPAAIVRSM